MGSLNKATIIGNLGKDAELKILTSGQSLATFRVATSERWNDKQTGEKVEKTEWHSVVLWGKTADSLQPYLTKGKQVYVEGRLETREYQKDGVTQQRTEIKADRVVLLGHKGDAKPDDGVSYPAAATPAPPPKPFIKRPIPQAATPPDDSFGGPLNDDEIPF